VKPNALAWRELVYNQWWTNQDLLTDANGDAVIRGFLGRYAISVEAGDGEKQQTIELQSNSQEAVVSFTAVPKTPTLPANGIVNAASFVGAAVAPGEIVTIFGEHFGAPALQHAGYQAGQGLSRDVAHTRVLFDGVPAPLLYSFRNQVSAIVPYGVKSETRLRVEYLGQRSQEIGVPVVDAAPGIFCLGQDGKGQAVAVNYDGGRNTLNGPGQPIARSDILTLFITGEGNGSPAVAEGLLPPTGNWPRPLLPVRALFGEAEGTVEFVGLVFAGVTQVNVRVPPGAPSGGAVPVVVMVGNASTQAGVTVSIQ
jgi:uncharacterized protein (TIGR03437 family)